MSVSPEELAAFADGELAEPRRSQVAAEVAQDEALAEEVRRHTELKAMLGAHFAPVLDQAVPDHLVQTLGGGEAKVADLATARQGREAKRGIPRWGWIAGPALAASLALAVFLPRGGSGHYAGDEVAAALDGQLVATQGVVEPVKVLVSFRDRDGDYCRAFSGVAQSGIACRDETGWKLEYEGEGHSWNGTEYQMAGSGNADLLAKAQEMAAGPALDAAGEEEAKAKGWR
ncbi:anti-sigma factor [Altererythrobacter salegens]|uniref:Anti-sigma factor n=1 Tax=Croceibacterium salegens TaxID=1737568 RepID=A0A6I4SW77_9SPHN|nr:anti-sigma factor [Croceibacterium salegens]MXO60251.1 anti-sigma factor [Croceibacterium salegens]